MVLTLHNQNEHLKRSSDAVGASNYEKRLEQLEREVNKDRQYGRRDSCEIMGINEEVSDESKMSA